jgi:hypothetical protein
LIINILANCEQYQNCIEPFTSKGIQRRIVKILLEKSFVDKSLLSNIRRGSSSVNNQEVYRRGSS